MQQAELLVTRPNAADSVKNVDDILRTQSIAASTTGAIAGARHPLSKRFDEVPGRRVASDIVVSNHRHGAKHSRLERTPSERRADVQLGEHRLTYERLQQYAVAHAALTAPARQGPKSTAGSFTFRRRAATMLPPPLPVPSPPPPLLPHAPSVPLMPSSNASQPVSPNAAATAARLALTSPGLVPPWLAPPSNGRPSSARRPTSPRLLLHRLGTLPQQLPPYPGAAIVPGSAPSPVPAPGGPASVGPPPERAFGPRATEYSPRNVTSPRGPMSVASHGGFPDPRAQPPRPQPPDAAAAAPGSGSGFGLGPGRTVGWQLPPPPQSPLPQPQPLIPSRGHSALGSAREQSPVKGHPRIGAESWQQQQQLLQQHQHQQQQQLLQQQGAAWRQESLQRQPSFGPPSPNAQDRKAQQSHEGLAHPPPPLQLPQPPQRQPSPQPLQQPHPQPPPPLPPPQQPPPQQQPQCEPHRPESPGWQLFRPRSPERRPASAAGPRRVVGLRDVPAAQLLAARALLSPAPGCGPDAGLGLGPRRRSSDGGTHADWWAGGADSEASYPLTAVTDRHVRGPTGPGEDDMTPSEAGVWLERMAALEAEVREEREHRRKYEQELQRLAAAAGPAGGKASTATAAAASAAAGGAGGAGGGGGGGVWPRQTSSGRVLTGARAAAAAVMRYRPGRPS